MNYQICKALGFAAHLLIAAQSLTNGRETSNKFVSPDDRRNVSQRALIRIESIRYGFLFSELLLFPQGNSCFIRRTPPRSPFLPSSVISWGGAGAAPPPSQANPKLILWFWKRKYHWIWQFKPTKSPWFRFLLAKWIMISIYAFVHVSEGKKKLLKRRRHFVSTALMSQ